MNRQKKILKNIGILLVLCFLLSRMYGFYLTPLAAHESSERSIHYGPSEVVHIEDFDGGKYILGKYDKWVSCNTVHRLLLFFWRFGSQPIGFENDTTKVVTFTWGITYLDTFRNHYVYGIINDSSIQKIEIILPDGRILTQTEFYDDLFLLTWQELRNGYYQGFSLRAYDSESNLVFVEDEQI